jgi:hypothetical protein
MPDTHNHISDKYTWHHISHKHTVPIPDIKNDPSTINDIAPLGFADEVEEGEVFDEVEIVDVPTVGDAAEDDNPAPTASAAAWKAAKELLVPLAPGLTANTIPFPQWLAGVFSPCRQ